MLMLRLQRIGKIKSPAYRLIVSEKTKDPQAGTLENLGQFDPTKQPKIIKFNAERIKYWLSKGAQPSHTVNNLLINAGIITGGKKKKSVYLSKQRKEKIAGKKAAAVKQAEEAATKAAPAPVPAAPAEPAKEEKAEEQK